MSRRHHHVSSGGGGGSSRCSHQINATIRQAVATNAIEIHIYHPPGLMMMQDHTLVGWLVWGGFSVVSVSHYYVRSDRADSSVRNAKDPFHSTSSPV